MAIKFYSIHKSVRIIVDNDVHSKTAAHIDFLLGYFRCKSDESDIGTRIHIRSYGRYSLGSEKRIQYFGSYSGVLGKCINNPDAKLAIEKDAQGFIIYNSRGRIPIYMFIQLLLVDGGMSLISAAAICDRDNRVTLLLGAGGAGKSSLSIELVKKKDFRLLGDDTVFLDGQGICRSFPRDFTLKDYNRHEFRAFYGNEKLAGGYKKKDFLSTLPLTTVRFIRDNAPFLGILDAVFSKFGFSHLRPVLVPGFVAREKKPDPMASIAIEKIVGNGNIAQKGRVDRIVYLERFSESNCRIDFLDPKLMSRRLLATINNEWALSMRLLFSMSVLDMADLQGHFNQVTNIIKSGIASKPCRLLMIPKNTHPKPLCDFFLSNF